MADDRTHVEAWRWITQFNNWRNDRRTQLRGRPRTKYISQIIQDAGTNTYRELKDMTSDRERWRRNLLWIENF